MKRIAYPPSTIIKLPNIFGDGSDGDVTITGTTTLTGDMQYNNLTINSGAVLNTGGYRVFVRNTLLNNGTIQNNGSDAVGATLGTRAGFGSLWRVGQAANGRSTLGNGNAASVLQPTVSWGNAYSGDGGAAGAQTAGSGTIADGDVQDYINLATVVDIFKTEVSDGTSVYSFVGGFGGGGGANGTGPAVTSGGGGGGGGVVLIAAKTINNVNGTIQALGGAGADASGTGDGGGGGGGSGGQILIGSLSAQNGTLAVTAGAGGAGVGAGAAGTAGSDGFAGWVNGVS